MPQEWVDRMQTVKTYEEDLSAMGRINAWGMAFNLAKSRLYGGGFDTFQEAQFAQFAPDPRYAADAHSIFFEVLGEHGFPGLAIFVLIAVMTWFSASKVMRTCKKDPELKWLHELMAMTQVSLVAYLVSGAFLGLAYFDYYYNLVLVVVVAKDLVAKRAQASMKGVPPREGRRPVEPGGVLPSTVLGTRSGAGSGAAPATKAEPIAGRTI